MNIFDKNRNDLSKYCYDLSKGSLLSFIIVPIVQQKAILHLVLAGAAATVLVLFIGMLLKKGD